MKAPTLSRSHPGAIALALGTWLLGTSAATAQDGPPAAPRPPKGARPGKLLHRAKAESRGTLGYGPPGLHPGFQGFGLGYHTGYGYGGAALGVGAEGGYPFYGGPGYPHPAPCLRRLGPIAPFTYYGGPGGSTPGLPNFYEPVGPLEPDRPVVTIPPDSPYAGDYGLFNGAIPYPETTFAEAATRAGAEATDGPGSSPGQNQPAAPSPTPPTAESVPGASDARTALGVDTEPVVDAGSARGLKVNFLQPGGEAERAGLKVGDVIRSANGFLTEQPGHLSWVVANAATDRILRLNVLAGKDGEARTITLRRP